jgi:tyrosyl-tRNA synthetase
MTAHPLLAELQWRGLIYQQTDGLAEALAAGRVTGYVGFDPTAASLHVGNLLVIMALVHLQRHGHRPIALVGGGTGMIGDPGGKSTERALLDASQVEANVRGIRAQLERFLDFDGPDGALMANNAEWLAPLKAIDFLRDTGKHFTVNYMLQKESVKARLEGGISFTEFSYMLLQAYDYLELHRRHGVSLQMGGSDQWGNITAGVELIRRVAGAEAHALTCPLVTTTAGTKFGKTESGAVWLDAERTSPYRFYQFWMNADDEGARRYLRYFTTLPREEIEALDRATAEHPERREAQQALASDITRRVHGDAALAAAREVSALLFGGAEPASLSAIALAALHREIPSFAIAPDVEADTQAIIDAVSTGEGALFTSRSDARRMLQQGGVYLNGARLGAERRALTPADVLHGRYAIVRKGARHYAIVELNAAR